MPDEFYEGKAITITQRQYNNFLKKINKLGDDECWPWVASLSKGGYGNYAIYSEGERKNTTAHRISYLLFVGVIPDGHHIDHLCRNRSCTNPKHLEAVTQKENILRGVGVTARNAQKTHCINGHEFSLDNTIISNVGRSCRECARSLVDKYQKELKEKVQNGYEPKPTKTHCKYGHLLSGENLFISPTKGTVQCRICNQERSTKTRLKRQYEVGKQNIIRQPSKSFCKRGHAMVESNIYRTPSDGGVLCRECRRLRCTKEYKESRKRA